MRVSECPGDPEVAAVHKEIYGARKGSTSQGVKISKKFVDPRESRMGCRAQGAESGGERVKFGSERVMLQRSRVKFGASVSCYSGGVDKLSRCGPVKALVALVAWRNRGMRSLRARGDLVQSRALPAHLGPGDCCVELVPAPGPASPTGPGSTCPPLLIRGSGMCDIDDTLVGGPIVGCCGAPGAGAGGGSIVPRPCPSLLSSSPHPSLFPLPSSLYEDLLFSS